MLGEGKIIERNYSSRIPEFNLRLLDFIHRHKKTADDYFALKFQEQSLRAKDKVPKDYIILTKYNINVTAESLLRIKKNEMLSDESINYYLRTLARTAFSRKKKYFFYSSFFFSQLIRARSFTEMTGWVSPNTLRRYLDRYALGSPKLAEWKANTSSVFSFEKIFVPVHQGMHWFLIVFDLVASAIFVCDSLGGTQHAAVKLLVAFFKEIATKEGFSFPCFLINSPKYRMQKNGVDCGVFLAMNSHRLVWTNVPDISDLSEKLFRRYLYVKLLTLEASQENFAKLKILIKNSKTVKN